MKNFMRNPMAIALIAACLYASPSTHAQPVSPPKPSAGVQTAFQVGTQIDGVMAESGLPNPYGLTGADYISSSGSSSGDAGHLETIEISAPAYAALQFAAATIYFEKKEYTKGKNCLKTAKWVLSDKDRAFTVQGGDLNALKSVTGAMPPVDPGVLESLDTILKKLADPATFFSTDSLSSLMSDLGDLKIALDKTIKDAKDAYVNGKYAEAVTTIAEDGPEALAGAINSMIANPISGGLNALTTIAYMTTYLATNESPNADAVADPVLVYSGEFRIEDTDLTVKSIGIDFAFKRIYRSQWERDSVVGFNWTHNFDQRLITGEGDSGVVLFKDASGQVYAFKPNADGGFTAPYQVLANLTKNEDGYELAYADGMRKRFDVGGFLTSIADRHGNEMTFTYHTFGKQRMLRKIKDTQGREYVLNYTDGRLGMIKDSFDRVVHYSHNALGDLVSVRSPTTSRYPKGRITRYNYSGGHTDPALNHNLTMIMDPKGQVYLANRYGNEGYEKDRVVGQRFGGEDTPEMTFRYESVASAGGLNDIASRTAFVDRLGVEHIYAHNDRGLRLSGEGYAYRYNDDGMKVKEVSPGGLTRAYRYDNTSDDPMMRQNLLTERIASPDGMAIEKHFTYGPYNQVKSQRVVAGTRGLTPQGPVPEVRTITHEFDQHGNISVTRRGDEITRYVHNASGQIIRTIQNGITRDTIFDGANPAVITESGGKLKRTTTLVHSGPGFLEGVTDPLNNTTRYWINELGLPVKRQDALGTVSDYVYDENKNLISMSLENKGGSNVEDIGYRLNREISYDVYDRPVLKRFAVDAQRWEEQRYEYDAEERLIAVTTPDGVRHAYTRNGKGLITAYRRNGKLQYVRRYDADNRLIYEKDGLGHQRWWVRDGMGRVVRHVMKDGTQALIRHTPFGELAGYRVFSVKDGTGALLAEKSFEYDDSGRLIKEFERAVGSTGREWYELERVYENGRLVALKNPEGIVQKISYDGLGRRSEIERTGAGRMNLAYDLNDRVIGRRVHNGQAAYDEAYTYDAAGRVTSATQAGSTERYAYDTAGNQTQAIDPTGVASRYTYDALGRRLTQTTGNRTRRWSWNERGLISSFTDGDDQTTSFAYDDDARMTARLHPDGVRDELTYDPLGRVINAIRGSTEYAYAYDPRGHLARRSSGKHVQEFTVDGLGRVVRTFDANDPATADDDVEVTISYNGLGKVTQESVNGRSTVYSYDKRGRPAQVRYPSSAAAERSFDEAGLLQSIAFDGRDVATYEYELAGLLKGERFANGTNRTLGYDSNLNLTREQIGREDKRAGIFDSAYEYDAQRRLTRATDMVDGMTTGFEYDDFDQLARVATAPGAKGSDGFDGLWKRATSKDEYQLTPEGDWKQAEGAGTIAVGSGHRYDSIGDDTLAYDDRGNLIRDGATTFVYDPWNRLTAVKRDGKDIAAYTYDAHNRRITKNVGDAAPTVYAYDRWNVIEEYEGAHPARRYVPGRRMDDPVALVTEEGRYFYHRNRLGNIVALTDASGEIVERYSYDPYGGMTITDAAGKKRASSAVRNPIAFTGQRYDAETGLYYFKNRYYSPKLGRFITKDPMGMVDGPNLYAYVNNDPTNWTDPLGTEKCGGGWIESASNAFEYGSGVIDSISPLTPIFHWINEQIYGEPVPSEIYGESYWAGNNLIGDTYGGIKEWVGDVDSSIRVGFDVVESLAGDLAPTVHNAKLTYLFFSGAVRTTAETAEGLAAVATNPIGTVGDLYTAVVNYDVVVPALWESTVEFTQEMFSSDEGFAYNLGRLGPEIIGIITGTSELNALRRVNRIVEVIDTLDDAADIAKHLDNIQDAAELAKVLDKIEDTDKMIDALRKLDDQDLVADALKKMDSEKAAKIASKMDDAADVPADDAKKLLNYERGEELLESGGDDVAAALKKEKDRNLNDPELKNSKPATLEFVEEHLNSDKRLAEYQALKDEVKIIDPPTNFPKESTKYKNAETLAKPMVNEAFEKSKGITSDIENVLAGNGKVKLVDLDEKFKDLEKLTYKIVDDSINDGVSLEVAADNVKDSLRYTVVVDEGSFGDEVNKIIKQISEQEGYTTIKVKNTFFNNDATYRGINTAFETPDGFKFEIQFHTETSRAVRNNFQNHKLKDLRDRLDAMPDSYKNANTNQLVNDINTFLAGDATKIPVPITSTKIPDFPPTAIEKIAAETQEAVDDVLKAANQ